MDKLTKIIRAYEGWVAKNPEVVGDFETTTKWVSYFIAGRISDSNIVSELIYSLSNVLVLYNDRIIDRSRDASAEELAMQSTGICYRLKVILTTLEYSEVFIEISAKRVFGRTGRWLVIALLQIFKAAGRLFILKNSTTHIITSPAIPTINRRALVKKLKANGGTVTNTSSGSTNNENIMPEHSITFQLKRSGRLIRKVEGAPPIQYRDFKLHAQATHTQRTSLPKQLLLAEYLYIAKPLIHLAAMGVFGERRWKQYLVSLSLDLLSIRIYYKQRHLMNKQQKLELSRRCINLLYYLMRSPFFECYTQTRLERILNFVAGNVPIVKMVAAPLRDYIPIWQRTYFYLWST